MSLKNPIVGTDVKQCPGCAAQVVITKYGCGCERIGKSTQGRVSDRCIDFKQFNRYCEEHRAGGGPVSG